MKLGLLLALKSITAVKFTNDFILKFSPNLTVEHIDAIAQKNGYINQETDSSSGNTLLFDDFWLRHFFLVRTLGLGPYQKEELTMSIGTLSVPGWNVVELTILL